MDFVEFDKYALWVTTNIGASWFINASIEERKEVFDRYMTEIIQ